MNLKRMACASTLAAGVGVAGLFGIGLGTAGADPGPPCGGWNAPQCNNGPGWNNNNNNGPGWNNNNRPGWNNNNGPVDWQHRGIDQGRQDHQPFLWNGQQVQPMPAGNGVGWGFWFLGQWIPL